MKWSDEDQCYIGYCPDLFYGGVCHGEDEETTYADLCTVVRDEIDHRLTKGENLPKPSVRDLDFAAAGILKFIIYRNYLCGKNESRCYSEMSESWDRDNKLSILYLHDQTCVFRYPTEGN